MVDSKGLLRHAEPARTGSSFGGPLSTSVGKTVLVMGLTTEVVIVPEPSGAGGGGRLPVHHAARPQARLDQRGLGAGLQAPGGRRPGQPSPQGHRHRAVGPQGSRRLVVRWHEVGCCCGVQSVATRAISAMLYMRVETGVPYRTMLRLWLGRGSRRVSHSSPMVS
jgi:hypothetical protein